MSSSSRNGDGGNEYSEYSDTVMPVVVLVLLVVVSNLGFNDSDNGTGSGICIGSSKSYLSLYHLAVTPRRGTTLQSPSLPFPH